MKPYPIPAPISLLWTVWHFRGLRGESVVAARRAEPQDLSTQHDFQRVLGQVWAYGPKEALAQVTAEIGGANGEKVTRQEPR